MSDYLALAERILDPASDDYPTVQEIADALREAHALKENRDYWMTSCQQAQEHRDGANAQLAAECEVNMQHQAEIARHMAEVERLKALVTERVVAELATLERAHNAEAEVDRLRALLAEAREWVGIAAEDDDLRFRIDAALGEKHG